MIRFHCIPPEVDLVIFFKFTNSQWATGSSNDHCNLCNNYSSAILKRQRHLGKLPSKQVKAFQND